MTNHFIVLLESIIKNPEEKISALEILTQEERQKMLTACESMISGIERQTTLQELFEEQVAQQPDSVAIVCEGIQITYRN